MWKEGGKKPVARFLLWNFAISWITIGFIVGLEQLHILPAAALKVIVMVLICFGSGMSPAYAVFIVLRKKCSVTFKEFVQRIYSCGNIKLTAASTIWSIWHIPLWFVSNANQSGFYFLSRIDLLSRCRNLYFLWN